MAGMYEIPGTGVTIGKGGLGNVPKQMLFAFLSILTLIALAAGAQGVVNWLTTKSDSVNTVEVV